MNSAVSNDVFLVPLRHLTSPVYSNEQVLTESTVRGLSSFVGDEENELLKYLVSDQSFQDTDWPLVLFGPTGTGKTSLALSVISMLTEADSASIRLDGASTKPMIYTAPDFARRFNSAIETNSVHDFRTRIFESSALLIDNIHLLSEQQHVQDELIIILNQMCERSVPVVLTSHQAPHSIPGLSVQLTSRLTNGLSLSVQAPGSSARRELIRKLTHIHDFHIAEPTIEWLATRLPLTVPKINQFFAQLKLSIAEAATIPNLDVGFFERLFDQSDEQQVIENSRQIIRAVALEFHLKPVDLKSNSRKQSVVQARGIAIYLCREQLKASFKKIGSWFGKRDHSTIMHSYQKTKAIIEADENSGITQSIVRLRHRLSEQFASRLNLSFVTIENQSESR